MSRKITTSSAAKLGFNNIEKLREYINDHSKSLNDFKSNKQLNEWVHDTQEKELEQKITFLQNQLEKVRKSSKQAIKTPKPEQKQDNNKLTAEDKQLLEKTKGFKKDELKAIATKVGIKISTSNVQQYKAALKSYIEGANKYDFLITKIEVKKQAQSKKKHIALPSSIKELSKNDKQSKQIFEIDSEFKNVAKTYRIKGRNEASLDAFRKRNEKQ